MELNQIFSSVVLLLLTAGASAGQGLGAALGYEWMTQLSGAWKLVPANRQEG